jgi:hypothetical protein
VRRTNGGGAAGCNHGTGRCRTDPASAVYAVDAPFVNKERSAQEYLEAIGYPEEDEQ